MSKSLDLICADGTTQRASLSNGVPFTVGNSAEADAQLGHLDELEPVHVLIVADRKDCWVACARDARTSALVDGKLFENGRLPWGTEIDIGSLTIRLENSAASVGASRVRLMLAAGVILVLATRFLPDVANQAIPKTDATPPEILSPLALTCPDADRAHELGLEHVRRGYAERNRYGFDARDGPRADRSFGVAYACLDAAGQETLKTEAAIVRDRIRKQLTDDYALHRLRLRNALEKSDSEVALAEADWLVRALEERPGEYRDWLERLGRHLAMRIEKSKGKKARKL